MADKYQDIQLLWTNSLDTPPNPQDLKLGQPLINIRDGVETLYLKNERGDGLIEFVGKNAIINIIDKIIEKSADEEDITTRKIDGSNKFSFANRQYDPNKFSGFGYKILRKNIFAGKNVLTQDMINDPNTIYEIRYDFDLNGASITIPDSCVLRFNGGSFSNGTINGNNTNFDGLVKLTNINFSGTFNNEIVTDTWFTNTELSDVFTKLVSLKSKIIQITKTYNINDVISIKIPSNTTVDGKGSMFVLTPKSSTEDSPLIWVTDDNNVTENVILKNMTFKSNNTTVVDNGRYSYRSAILVRAAHNVVIDSCVFDQINFGVRITDSLNEQIKSENINVINCVFNKNRTCLLVDDTYGLNVSNNMLDLSDADTNLNHHIYISGNAKDLTFNNNTFKNCKAGWIHIFKEGATSEEFNGVKIIDNIVENSATLYVWYANNILVSGNIMRRGVNNISTTYSININKSINGNITDNIIEAKENGYLYAVDSNNIKLNNNRVNYETDTNYQSLYNISGSDLSINNSEHIINLSGTNDIAGRRFVIGVNSHIMIDNNIFILNAPNRNCQVNSYITGTSDITVKRNIFNANVKNSNLSVLGDGNITYYDNIVAGKFYNMGNNSNNIGFNLDGTRTNKVIII